MMKIKELFNKIVLSKLAKRNNIKVRTKLLLFFLLLSIIPVAIVGYFSYRGSENTIENKVGTFSHELVKQMTVNVNSKIQEFETSTTNILADGELTHLLLKTNYEDQFQKMQDHNKISEKLSGIVFSNDALKSILVYRKDASNITAGSVNEKDIFNEDFKNTKVYKNVMNENGKNVWITGLNGSFKNIYLMRKLTDTGYGFDPAVLVYKIPQETFDSIYKSTELGKGSSIFLLNEDKKMISALNSELIGKNYTEAGVSRFYKDKKNGYFVQDRNLITFGTTSNAWKLAAEVPMASLMGEVYEVGKRTIIIGVICALAAVLLGIGVSLSISLPLKEIMKKMRKGETGDLTIDSKIKGSNEIAQLSLSFNNMIENIRQLVKGVRRSGNEVRNNTEKIKQFSDQAASSAQEVSAAIENISEGAMEQADEAQESMEAMGKLSDKISSMSKNLETVLNSISQIKTNSNNAVGAVEVMNERTQDSTKMSAQIKNDINKLNNKAQKISKFVELIDSISDQTSLLSLNASIEAARAGEAGKGFSVVAEEVRGLADETNEATRMISEIVEDIFKETQKTVEEVEEADVIYQEQKGSVQKVDTAFEKINNSIENIVRETGRFEQAVEDMKKHKETVSEEISDMAAIAEESAAATEEVSAATEEQVASAEELADMAAELEQVAQDLSQSLNRFDV